ncbi:sensor histidine kinase [Romboutsia lituseburensis]|uniref:histidine kinase n=1 Tax=Romboutsia lituseburensis DSM 797 TaxID=1121325 RepID=A0A1G9ILP2_9FIRM|nr:ABC transporter substrate binding protein [Romboutsia lituseburensis]CEH33844.1 Hybrid signal transduction histidine kinase D [Romboutsia lituseburensis]SDL26040.1 Signal transduction histidine kinase [Romboutsia lituseburensis DSM 797]
MESKKAGESVRLIFGIMLFIISFVVTSNYIIADSRPEYKHVLYISSYNPNFVSFNDQVNGIKKEIGDNVVLQIEYMDTKTFSSKENEENFYNSIKYKLKNYKKFDVVVCGDDRALNFSLKHRNELFKDIPLVYLGVSEVKLASEANNEDNVYGVTEFPSIKENIDLISRLHSGKNIIAITDNPTEASTEIKEFYNYKNEYKSLNFEHISLAEITFADFAKRLSKLTDDDVLLVIYAYTDKSGNVLGIEESSKFILEHTDVPVYGVLDYHVKEGFIGGSTISHITQGEEAGKMVKSLLEGKKPKRKIITGDSINHYTFNYNTMKKYGIKKWDIPRGSEIYNDPIDILKDYKEVVIATIILLISLIIVIIVLVLYMIKRLHYEKELLKAKELAENTNKAQNNFISNISHELRTPIAVIMSSNQLLELNINKEKSNYFESNVQKTSIIKQNCNRLIRLTNNIIDIAKIDSGFMNLKTKNIDIVFLIESIVNSVVPYAATKNIDIVFDTNEEEVIMSIDPDKIERIILNLMSNAIKFSQENTNIYVTVEKSEDTLMCSVKDTGIGMEKKHLENIFERFTQIDDIMVRKNEGSGIGLSLVKSFINLHGGDIKVKSSVGEGSEFTVYLPIKLDENSELEITYEVSDMDAVVLKTGVEFSDIYF